MAPKESPTKNIFQIDRGALKRVLGVFDFFNDWFSVPKDIILVQHFSELEMIAVSIDSCEQLHMSRNFDDFSNELSSLL